MILKTTPPYITCFQKKYFLKPSQVSYQQESESEMLCEMINRLSGTTKITRNHPEVQATFAITKQNTQQ